MTTVHLPRAVWQAIAEAAQAAFPEECCGLLVGRPADAQAALRITRAIATDNVVDQAIRHRRFEVDPRRHFAVLRELRGSTEMIVGHYHSHPGGAAAPSAADRAHIYDPRLVWLIVAVAGGRVDAQAYKPDPGSKEFAPLPLVID
jgi:proteasome lid subunit RPN8/RPN11